MLQTRDLCSRWRLISGSRVRVENETTHSHGCRNPGFISAVLGSHNSIKNIPIRRELFLLTELTTCPTKVKAFWESAMWLRK